MSPSWVKWLLLCAALAGCDASDSSARRSPNTTVRIALVAEAKDEPTWPVVQDAAARITRQLGRVTVDTLAPETSSPRRQRELLQDLLDRDVDVVCVSPTEPHSLQASIDALVRKGVPVLTFGRDVRGSDRTAFVGPSQMDMGRSAAKACKQVLPGGRGSIIVMIGGLQDRHDALRNVGFKQALRIVGGIDVIREVSCGGDPLDAARLARAEAQMYPRVGGWVFLDDWPFRGLAPEDRLADALAMPLRCKLVVCHGSPRYFDRLRNGEIHALIGYDYRDVVDRALSAAVGAASARDRKTPNETVPSQIITIGNLDSAGGHAERWAAWSRADPD